MKNTNGFTDMILIIIDKLLMIEKNNILIYGENLKLYPSEIHAILLIPENGKCHFGEIVHKSGVTKGAVSQTITRLVKKGILVKKNGSGKNTDLQILFTPLGKKVRQKCEKVRNSLFEQIYSYFASLPENEMEIIGRFLGHFNDKLDEKKQLL